MVAVEKIDQYLEIPQEVLSIFCCLLLRVLASFRVQLERGYSWKAVNRSKTGQQEDVSNLSIILCDIDQDYLWH